MNLLDGVLPVYPQDYARVVEVWEASVRATHDFVKVSDIEIFRPLVWDSMLSVDLACMRDAAGHVVGFIGTANENVEMLFIHPDWRGLGVGRTLLKYAIEKRGATALDVNEQNDQALGFYLHIGFEVAGCSELDTMGKPYPLLHMRLATAPIVHRYPPNEAGNKL